MAWVDPQVGYRQIAAMQDADLVTAINLIWKVACRRADEVAFDLLFHAQVSLGVADEAMKGKINEALTGAVVLPPIYAALVAEATSRGLTEQLQNTERAW